MGYYNSLVAGGDDPGYQDGDFYRARFSHPSGLCLDDKGERLFVADQDNNRIRVVYLSRDNRVETLSGRGTAGHSDGPLSTATFNKPTAVAFIPPDHVAVFDSGDQLLRVIDLKAGRVSTFPGGPLGGAWNLVYAQKEGGLYISLPKEGKIDNLDWKTQKLTTVLANNLQLPHPKALCFSQGELYASDQDFPNVYRMDMAVSSTTAGVAVNLVEVGKGDHIQELAGSVSFLYALQSSDIPLVRILPSSQAVSLATPWGFMVDNQNPELEPLLKFDLDVPIGFTASPGEERKLFISYPGSRIDDIISVKDYDFDKWWKTYSNYNDVSPKGGFLCDFDYPTVKPPKTFRILVVGESRVLTAPVVDSDARLPSFNEYQWTMGTIRTNTFPKQLELLLNTEGILQDSETRFEVLVLGAHGDGPSSYVYDVVPAFVKKYDVDLVFVLAGKSGYEDYFTKPIRPEGIPVFDLDPEYLLKPLSERVPPGIPARFYERCLKKGIVKGGLLPYWFYILGEGDSDIRRDLMAMTAKPLKLFEEKLKSMRTSSGTAPRLAFFYIPWRNWSYKDKCEAFWVDLCRENHFTLLNLTDPFIALETSYYPTNQASDMRHYTAGGNTLIAELLSYYLRKQKWFSPDISPPNRGSFNEQDLKSSGGIK